ncbi:hypothetical protein PLESTB_000882000 [Pleodorina starrii]|uniref:AB hydrolase-1 domain-containing protein n=1 Tax=Pleodorina starrii TaxID=330485 RepID=A0A9W6F2U3_9CHLO|nr:hypothetical protein PLESTB_000882000 [Pleodorina starrii]
MAADGLALMDHLGWHRAHVVGHSMGAMISARLALAEPDRVASLTLISTTGGGTEAIPLNARALWTALKGMSSRAGGAGAAGGIGAAAAAAAVKRARVDLAFHFSPRLLKTKDPVSGRSVKDLLVEEYVAASKENGPQPKAGEEGHLNAVMKHGLSASERRRLAAAGFPIKVLHGSEDIVAEPRHARRLAGQLRAPLVMMDGAHFITRDCAVQVVDELLDTVEAVRQGATHVDAVHMLPERVSCFCCA